MRRMLLIICLVLVLPGSALAASDIVATYKYPDGSMVTLVTRDKDHVRMDTSATSYMLLSKGKVYSVNCEDGRCQAMDMGAMMNSGLDSLFGGGGDTDYEIRFEKTGRTETVAGYKGAVYEAVTFENGKVASRDEMVFSTHADIKKLTEGWMALAEVMSQSMGDAFDDSLDEARKMGYGGMLRMGDDMRLHKLSVKNLDAAYYRLPANAQQVQPRQSGGEMGIEDDAKDIGHDAKEATKDEIKSGIRDAISDLFQ